MIVRLVGSEMCIRDRLLFVIGMSTPSQRTMNEEDIAAWKPSAEQLPDANRIMYRVDVTIDEPKKTTILCGPCGVVTELDGDRPTSFTCPACKTFLYEDEEE